MRGSDWMLSSIPSNAILGECLEQEPLIDLRGSFLVGVRPRLGSLRAACLPHVSGIVLNGSFTFCSRPDSSRSSPSHHQGMNGGYRIARAIRGARSRSGDRPKRALNPRLYSVGNVSVIRRSSADCTKRGVFLPSAFNRTAAKAIFRNSTLLAGIPVAFHAQDQLRP